VKRHFLKIMTLLGSLSGAFCLSCAPAEASSSVAVTSSSEIPVSSSFSSAEKASAYAIGENDNTQGSVGYEIFTGSFADSNGDGIGDFEGIKNHLPYLKALGVHRLWLTPIFPSPTYHGYDVKDYYAVNPSFGTLTSFDALVTAAHASGFEVILDLVINHTSSAHPWFSQSEQDYKNNNTSSTSKKDWYCWQGASNTSATSSSHYNSDSVTGVGYEANFDSGMPELNLANAAVVSEIDKIASFWLTEHAVDGFRLDGVRYYWLNDTAQNIAFLTSFKAYCRSAKPSCYLVGEMWGDPATDEGLASYSAAGFPFFAFTTSGTSGDGFGAAVSFSGPWGNWTKEVAGYQQKIANASSESEPAFFITNHDQDRWANSIATGQSDQLGRQMALVSMYLLTPGTPWAYYGEEIRMWGTRSGADSQDYARRLGMVWGQGEKRPMNPGNYNDSAKQVTVGALDALADGASFLNHERQVIAVRNRHNELFQKGIYSALSFSSEVSSRLAGFSILSRGKTYYLVHNKGDAVMTTTLEQEGTLIEDIDASLLPSSYEKKTLTLQAHSSVLIAVN
jgi:alpha-amylase